MQFISVHRFILIFCKIFREFYLYILTVLIFYGVCLYILMQMFLNAALHIKIELIKLYFSFNSDLQIKRGNRDNSEIILVISQ